MIDIFECNDYQSYLRAWLDRENERRLAAGRARMTYPRMVELKGHDEHDHAWLLMLIPLERAREALGYCLEPEGGLPGALRARPLVETCCAWLLPQLDRAGGGGAARARRAVPSGLPAMEPAWRDHRRWPSAGLPVLREATARAQDTSLTGGPMRRWLIGCALTFVERDIITSEIRPWIGAWSCPRSVTSVCGSPSSS